jgi:hypothetical protein
LEKTKHTNTKERWDATNAGSMETDSKWTEEDEQSDSTSDDDQVDDMDEKEFVVNEYEYPSARDLGFPAFITGVKTEADMEEIKAISVLHKQDKTFKKNSKNFQDWTKNILKFANMKGLHWINSQGKLSQANIRTNYSMPLKTVLHLWSDRGASWHTSTTDTSYCQPRIVGCLPPRKLKQRDPCCGTLESIHKTRSWSHIL